MDFNIVGEFKQEDTKSNVIIIIINHWMMGPDSHLTTNLTYKYICATSSIQ